MKKDQPREISVFIASPGDLSPERKVFKSTIDELNAGFADGAGVRFVALGWEDVPAETGRRPQAVINQQIKESDFFILALNRRWGQKAPDSKFSSYTEEEFNIAFDLWKEKKAPEVVVFFKSVDSASVADPGPELTKVLAFRKELEEGRLALPKMFNSETDFGTEVDKHLRAFARGEYQRLENDAPIDLPDKDLGEPSSQVANGAKPDLSLVQAHQKELALARAAVDAARNSRLQDARILFAQATEGTTDPSILSVAAEFFRQVGDPENASRLVQRQIAVSRDRTIAARHYMALVPPGFFSYMSEQALEQMLAQQPPEAAEEIRSIYEEAFGNGRLEEVLLDAMVKYYTEAELVQFARFLASPEGQSSLLKYPEIMAETMQIGASEFQRIYLNRHPELAAGDDQPDVGTDGGNALSAPAQPPNQLSAGDSDHPAPAGAQGPNRTNKPN